MLAVFAGAAFGVGLLLNGTSVPEASAAGVPSIAVPAYFWPGAQWDALLNAGSEVKYTVLNPDSGPGAQAYAGFTDVVTRARARGFTVVGYVDTAYGTRARSVVEADIASYRSFYGINQFFFDQTPSACVSLPYYAALETFVQLSANGFIIHNPGTNPEECYLDVADMVVNFEGTETSYAGWAPSAYVASYSPDRFWNIVYDVSATNGSALMALAGQRNIGFVYLTDDGFSNPFDRIPASPLWQAQVPSARPPRGVAPQAPGVSGGGRGSAPQAGPGVTTTTTTTPRTPTTSTTAAPPAAPTAVPPAIDASVVVVPPLLVPPAIVPPSFTAVPSAVSLSTSASALTIPPVDEVFDDPVPGSMPVVEEPKPIIVDVLGEAIRAVQVDLQPVAGPAPLRPTAGPVFPASPGPAKLGLRVTPTPKASVAERGRAAGRKSPRSAEKAARLRR